MNVALSSSGRTRQKIFFLFFTSLLLISFLAFQTSSTILSPLGGENNSFPIKNNSPPISSKISSEEESIDSFDVHPQSARWENILDDAIVDRITDSSLEVLVVNNETSGTDGFEMNRGTTKTDGKFEWRMKSDGSGNQTEIFRDQLGDESDFTEDTEGWGGLASQTASDGILTGTMAVGVDDRLLNSLDWSSTIYHTLEFKIKANVEDLIGHFRPQGIRHSSNFALTTSWITITLLREDSSAWEDNDRILTDLTILFDEDGGDGTLEATDQVFIDHIKLIGDYDFATHVESEIEDTWDYEEGDQDGWTDASGNDEAVIEGRYQINYTGVSADLRTGGADSIDTSIFTILKVRVFSNVSSPTIRIFRLNGFLEIGSSTAFSSGSFVTLTFDLSTDSDWTGIATGLRLFYPGAAINDQLKTEFILLLGSFNPSDSVIGLMDSDKNPLLNISTHFFGNDSARFEFELLDSTGELSYHFYSDLFDDLNQFIRGKVTFDVLRSRLEITLTAENNSRIDKITFPNEFIVDSGLIPSLFSNVISPDIFVSTFTIDHSWQTLFLDWIKADFKRSEWVQTSTPSDSDWLEDRWDIAKVQDDISDDSAWDLYVPYLDTVSASLTMQFDNQTLGIDDGDLAGVGFQLIGVDSDDGDEHAIYQLSVVQFREDDGGLKWFTEGAISENGSITVKDFERNAFPLDESPRLSFSMSLSEERNIASCKVRFWHNRSDLTDFFDLVAEINITTAPFTDLSQEFILRTSFTADLLANNEFVGMVEDFGFTDLDIFQDIANAVIEPIGNFLQTLFTAAFKFLADIFRAVGDIIGLAISVMQGVLEGAINAVAAAILTMQGAIEIAVGLVTTAIDALKTAFDTALGLVQTAIDAAVTALGDVITELQGLAAAIATAVWDGIGSALDFITDAVGEIWTILIATIADILDEIVTVVLTLLTDIVDIVVGIVFFAWDAIGLPDILALGNDLIVLYGQLIEFLISTLADVIQLGTDLAWVILVVWWIWAIPVQWARANFEPISGLGNFIEVFFYDIFPWNILGFHAYIPQGVVFTLWLILILPADFALFTAMGL